MLYFHRVLLPKRIFEVSKSDAELEVHIFDYMQRYPDYEFLYEENGFAICERKNVRKEAEHE